MTGPYSPVSLPSYHFAPACSSASCAKLDAWMHANQPAGHCPSCHIAWGTFWLVDSHLLSSYIGQTMLYGK
jgi:hypothetical protein